MNTSSSNWDSPSTYLVYILKTIFGKYNKWRFIGPRLRLLNSSWRDAVDWTGYSVSTRRLYASSPSSDLACILKQRSITRLNLCPMHGRTIEISTIAEWTDALTSLQDLKLEQVDNGHEVLLRVLPMTPHLSSMDLDSVRLSDGIFQSIATLRPSLENLRLRGVQFSDAAEKLAFQSLGKLTRLKSLAIEYCDQCTDLQFLTELSGLETLVFTTDQRQVSNLHFISGLNNLRSLSLMTSTVREEDLADLILPGQLRAVKVDKHHSSRIWSGGMTQLTSLAFQSKMSTELKSWLTRHETSIYSIVPPFQRRGIRSPVYHREGISVETSYIKSLVTVDLTNICVAPSIFSLLAECANLRELRVHMSLIAEINQPSSHVDDIDSLTFPTLRLLTLNPSSLLIRLLQKMKIPLLEHVGIWFDAKHPELVAESVQALPEFREISFAVNDAPTDDDFWTRLLSSLIKKRHVRRIGWKQYEGERMPLPDNFTNSLTMKSVFIDDDATVFLQKLV